LVVLVVGKQAPGLSGVSDVLLHFGQYAFVKLDLVLADDDAVCLVGGAELLEPLAFSYLVQVEPGVRVCVEDALEQFLALVGEYLGGFIVASHDLLVEFAGAGVLEGQVAAEHGVEDDAAAPDVCPQTVVAFARYHFGSSVAGTAAGGLEPLAGLVVVGESEVYDFDVVAVVEEEVLGLEVAVDDAVLVDVVDACDDLLHEGDGLLLAESLVLDDVVEELAALCVLHDEVDVGFGLDDLGGRGGTS